jgi:hypothetical protein
MDEAHSISVGILKELLRACCASDSVFCPTPAKLTITLSGDAKWFLRASREFGTKKSIVGLNGQAHLSAYVVLPEFEGDV